MTSGQVGAAWGCCLAQHSKIQQKHTAWDAALHGEKLRLESVS